MVLLNEARPVVAVAVLAVILAGCGAAPESGDMTGGVGTSGSVAPPLNGGAGVGGGLPVGGSMQPGTGTAGTGSGAQGSGTMPCDIEEIVSSGCHTCHGATPIGGAPMPLVTLADFQRDYTVVTTTQLRGQTMKMHQLAKIRINAEMGTGLMPQGTPLSAPNLAALNTWLVGGAQAGAACGSNMGPGTVDSGTGGGTAAGSGGVGGAMGGAGSGTSEDGSECDVAGAFEALVAVDGETCYNFRVHGTSSPTDSSKFSIPTGETYSQFYYNVPWAAGALATRFGSDFDNLPVLHHWLAFSSTSGNAAGTVTPNVIGTTAGENAELIAGWAVGGCTTSYPEDVGVKLPTSGKIMVQWHHYNHTAMTQPDSSAVQICTVPAGGRPNVAGLTFLGTENLNGLGGMGQGMHNFSGTCLNDSGAPITIIGFTPHMHNIGVHMRSVVMRAAGGQMETVFDKPFQFDYQVNYRLDPPIVLQPNDRITSTCTFLNDTGGNVGFGVSSTSEMCYQFALSYPYGALNNAVPSLIAATNTCW